MGIPMSKQSADDRPWLDRRTAGAIMQSWTNAVKQSGDGDRFLLRIVITRKEPGKEPEQFEI